MCARAGVQGSAPMLRISSCAVNEQKDVVFDGTMTWAPFVQQTIAMVRDHRHNYKRGPGFVVDDEGNSYER